MLGCIKILYLHKNAAQRNNKQFRKKALIQGDAAAISKLNYLLKNYSDNIVQGFDGIIVYSSLPKPRMIGLATGRTKAEIDYIKNTRDLKKVEASFCMVMPEVVTNP